MLHLRHSEWLTGRGVLMDAVVAIVSFAVFTAPLLVVRGGEGVPWAVALFGAAAVVPLVVRRRLPGTAVVGVGAVLAAAAFAGIRFTPFVSNAGPALGIAAYSVGVRRPRWASLVLVGAISAVLAISTGVALRLHPHQDQDAIQVAIAAVGWLAGDSVRTHRQHRAEVDRQRAERDTERDARVRSQERLRLSRDVHDLVSHTLSMIAVRSGVARLLVDQNPQEASEALEAIQMASRRSLDELRRILRETRDPLTTPSPAEPTLADLGQLADNIRSAGIHLDLLVADDVVDPLLQTTIYRITQEALTNVVKHAQARTVQVHVGKVAGAVQVDIRDDGVGREPGALDGIGTNGMRERTKLFGGSLDTGARDDGSGYRVVARFPREHPDS